MNTISVIIGTYNGAKYLREQLDSILQQSYPPYEIIVQDDGSTDDTVSILKEYAKNYTQVKIFFNNGEHGINNNYFSAFRKASGDYIAISDQDDIWEKDKLKWQMEAIGDKLLCSGFFMLEPCKGRDMRLPNYHLLRLLYVGNALPGYTLLFSRKLLDMIPNLESFMKVKTCDTLIAIVAASYNSVAYVERPLVRHRLHMSSATYSKPVNNRKTISNIFLHIVDDLRWYRELRPKVTMILGNLLECMKEIDSTEEVYKDAITMLKLQISNSFIDFVRLQYFCVKNCTNLFYARERKTPQTMLRGLFFPISCYEYYRYLSKRFSD